jgi:hypothetical protein
MYFDKTTDWDEFLTLKTGLTEDASATFEAKNCTLKSSKIR